jgi:predicted ATPase
MEFHVEASDRPPVELRPNGYPAAVLSPDPWDDYGLKPMFSVSLHLASGSVLELDTVKIFHSGQSNGVTRLPVTFTKLDDSYCSLGQATSYYELLLTTSSDIYESYLAGLQDLAFMRTVRDRFVHDDRVQSSLLRSGAAQRALADGAALFGESPALIPQPVSFRYMPPDATSPAEFRFRDATPLPNRLTAIIGYNGAGKTRFLANLAMLAHADEAEAREPTFVRTHGAYAGEAPSFGATIAISYSAFDDFAVPGQGRSGNARLDRKRASEGRASVGNYTYCGLRQVRPGGKLSSELKSIEQVTEEFHLARGQALSPLRLDTLREALMPIRREPSFQTVTELPDILAKDVTWRAAFQRLSTGHKIVLLVVAQLCARLERRSLVLFDEPELHLHPPLLAALLRSLAVALERYDSFGVVATHSPIVLQEIPARHVIVLRRNFDYISVEPPELETFAENIGTLTKHVFNLDSSDTDYQGILRELARGRTLEQILDLFDGRLSSQGRSLILSFQRSTDIEPDA